MKMLSTDLYRHSRTVAQSHSERLGTKIFSCRNTGPKRQSVPTLLFHPFPETRSQSVTDNNSCSDIGSIDLNGHDAGPDIGSIDLNGHDAGSDIVSIDLKGHDAGSDIAFIDLKGHDAGSDIGSIDLKGHDAGAGIVSIDLKGYDACVPIVPFELFLAHSLCNSRSILVN